MAVLDAIWGQEIFGTARGKGCGLCEEKELGGLRDWPRFPGRCRSKAFPIPLQTRKGQDIYLKELFKILGGCTGRNTQLFTNSDGSG